MTNLETPIEYGELVAAVDHVLPQYVIVREGLGKTFDYWPALEAACFALGVPSDGDLANLVDGMILDAVEARWGALADARLVPAHAG